MKNRSTLKKILYSLIIIFILIVNFFVIPTPLSEKRIGFLLVAILGLLFLFLGIILIFLARKEKGKLRLFLILTGASAISPLPFSILHNLFYALAIVLEDVKLLFEILDGASFIIALLIAPITFIVGVIGSIVLLRKRL
jgi:hypothetical protein